MKTQRKNMLNVITIVICIFVIVCFYIKNIGRLIMPSIIYDEIGYWAIAAWWNGWNWSSVMSSFSSYYSYGYSIILFVLMKLFHDPSMLHQSAVIFNIFMIVLGYICILKIIHWLFPNINTVLRNILCVLPLFYPSIQYHTQVAWPETLLFILFIVSIILAQKVAKEKSVFSFIMFAVFLVFMYVTHQRTLGIVFGGIIFAFIVSVLNKSWKQFMIFIGALIIIFIFISMIKGQILISVYSNSAGEVSSFVKGNDYSGQINKVKFFFSLEGFYGFLISILGKIYYFLIASFFFGGYGIIFLAKFAFKVIKRTQISMNELISFYVLSAFFATLIISAMFMIYPGRIDTVAYGRYTDFIGVVIIAVGIFYLLDVDKKEKLIILLGEIIFVLAFTTFFQSYIQKYNVPYKFFASCSPLMMYFSNLNNEDFVRTMTLGMILASVGLFILTLVKYKNIEKYIFCFMAIFLWYKFTYPSIEEMIRIQHHTYLTPIIAYLNSYPTDNIYYLYNAEVDNASDYDIGSIQYSMQGREVRCITDMAYVIDNGIVLTSSTLSTPSGYTIQYSNAFFNILEKDL